MAGPAGPPTTALHSYIDMHRLTEKHSHVPKSGGLQFDLWLNKQKYMKSADVHTQVLHISTDQGWKMASKKT